MAISTYVFILIGVLVLYALAILQYITLSGVTVSRTKSLLIAIKFGKEVHFPHQKGLLLLPKTNNWPYCGHGINCTHQCTQR